MTIHSELISDGKVYKLQYQDVDSFDQLPPDRIKQVYGVCWYGDKFVIGFRGKKKAWGLIGGSVEKGETIEQTLLREIQEESNMRVLRWVPIGYQEVASPEDDIFYQLRVACTVEPIGDFISDPDVSITEIKLVSPDEYKNYFDWGEIGDRIIERAVQTKRKIFDVESKL